MTRSRKPTEDTTVTASGGGLEPVVEPKAVPTLVLVHCGDASRLGERAYPGRERMPLNRIDPILPGGPLTDPEVSRRHAELVAGDGGGHLVRDLGSKNGTFVNGRRAGREGVRLADGDVIRIGDTLLLFRRTLDPAPPREPIDGILGDSDETRCVRSAIFRYAALSMPVLVQGETGTGKELVAGALARMGRPRGPMVAFNAGAVPANLVESTLFGHVRGAFTDARKAGPGLFRAAHGGTLFMDEVGELSSDVQTRLLRVLENGEVTPVGSSASVTVDVRVVAATNRDLLSEAGSGRFRQDLYARLAYITIAVPPLRERRDDIPILAAHFAKGREVSCDYMGHLMSHPWPFNVRELKAAIEQSKADSPGGDALHLSTGVRDRMARHRKLFLEAANVGERSLDREAVEAILRKAGGNMTRAAEEAGKDRGQFYRMVKRLGLDPDEYR